MTTLERRPVVRKLLDARKDDLLVISGLGSPTWDVAAAGDHPLNYYLNGVMGSACAVGLGLALAKPEHRVMVITGDGELLMALGILATIGVVAPRNLTIVVLDNERYAETGNQPTHTAHGVDLATVARGCTIPVVSTIYTQPELEAALPSLRTGAGPVVAVIKIVPDRPHLVLPPLDAAYMKHRMRERLTGRP